MAALTEQMTDTSFEALFLAHYDRVYGILFRIVGSRAEAEDLAQEVFLKLYRRPPRRADSNLSAWLYRVATNSAYNHVRARRRRQLRDRLLPIGGSVEDPLHTVERTQEQAAVRRALLRLPRRQAQLLLLRQMGLSYRELAQACDVAPGSVGQLLARAAKAFRAAYLKEQ